MSLILASAVTTFVSQAIAFVILAAVLLKFAKPVLSKVLTERTRNFAETFDTIEKETSEAQKSLAELKRQLADVEQEAKRRMVAAVEEANQARSRAITEAKQQAEAELAKARREIEIEKSKAILELRQETTRLTLAAAEHLVQAAMNDGIQGQMVEKYLTKLDRVKNS